MNPTVGFPFWAPPPPPDARGVPSCPIPCLVAPAGLSPHVSPREQGGLGLSTRGCFPRSGTVWWERAAGQVGVWKKTHECEGFSSDMWRLFDPETGQLSRQERA